MFRKGFWHPLECWNIYKKFFFVRRRSQCTGWFPLCEEIAYAEPRKCKHLGLILNEAVRCNKSLVILSKIITCNLLDKHVRVCGTVAWNIFWCDNIRCGIIVNVITSTQFSFQWNHLVSAISSRLLLTLPEMLTTAGVTEGKHRSILRLRRQKFQFSFQQNYGIVYSTLAGHRGHAVKSWTDFCSFECCDREFKSHS